MPLRILRLPCYFFTAAYYDVKQLALDPIFLGNINVDSVKANIWILDLTGRYTLTDRMQIDLNIPFLYRSTTYSSGGGLTAPLILIPRKT